MSKIDCSIIKDLLPLYADEVCSEESRKLVAEHIEHCTECKAELEKMGINISVSAEKDIKVVKRIKKRIRTEKIIVSLVAVLCAFTVVFFSGMYLLNAYVPYKLDTSEIGENVSTELDKNGDMWLIIKDYNIQPDYVTRTISDSSGNHLGVSDNFDKDKSDGVGFYIEHHPIDCFQYDVKSENGYKLKMFNVNEKENFEKFFYYDVENNKEYILWERG